MAPLTYDKISPETFKKTVARYPSLAPKTPKWRDLDELRYETIPIIVEDRKKETEKKGHEEEDRGVCLKKEEVVSLMEWKLMHGTFRPTLMTLIRSNADALIEEKTRKAFRILNDPASGPSEKPRVLAALTHLSTATQHSTQNTQKQKLAGVGPATASLFLSVFDMQRVPFFSDEVFRWVMWEGEEAEGSARGCAGGSTGVKGKKGVIKAENGWKKKIKYDMKGYAQLLERVAALRERLGVSAVEVERCAWVLGGEGVDVARDGDDGGNESKGKGDAEVEKRDVKTEKTKGTDQVTGSGGEKTLEQAEKRKGTEKAKTKGKGKEDKEKKWKLKEEKQTLAKRKREEPVSPPEGLRRSTRQRTSGS